MKLIRRLGRFLRRSRDERDMSEEMRAHVEMQAERNRAAGMSSEEARNAALRAFGNVASVQERAREARGWVWLEQFAQDLRYACRQLTRTPGVTITAVVTLALGIGVNAALLAVYDILALRPLPTRESDQLVDIRGRNERVRGGADPRFSYADYLDYCAETEAFSDLVAVTEIGVKLLDEAPLEVEAPGEARSDLAVLQAVSGNYFPVLGTELAMGRDFQPEEAGVHAGRPVMIVSHQFWQGRLRGDPHVLGRVLVIQQRPGERSAYTIIGVAGPGFVGQSPLAPVGWIPIGSGALSLNDRSKHLVSLTGRLREGVTYPQAQSDLEVIAQRLARSFPEERRANAVSLLPAMRILNTGLNRELAVAMSPVLLGFVLVLVVACLNVANLLLARGVTRQHEIGVRLVLGAGRGRLVRQLFAENLVLCALGAAAALVLAMWALQALKPALVSALAAEPKAQAFVSTIEIGLDSRIIGFGALLAIVAGLTAGLAPALHSVRRDGMFALKSEGTAFGRNVTPAKLRALLLVGQVAACLTLLAVCGLMTGKLLRTRASSTGFAMDGVYVMLKPSSVEAAGSSYAQDMLGAVEALRTLPGVVSACLVADIPLRKPGDNVRSVPVRVAGEKPTRISHNRVSAGFFESFGVPVVRGRAFTPQEISRGAQVVIVSESAAQRLWPGQEALGKVLSVDDSMFVQRTWAGATEPIQGYRECEVIGVSRDFMSNWGGSQNKDIMLLPLPPKVTAGSILVRVEKDSTSVLRGVENTAAAAGIPLKFAERLETVVDRGLWPYRAFASISGALTALALVLATVGLYGVVSFGVNQRTREIGVRMALGATADRVTGFFVRQGMRLVAFGIVLGLAGGAAFAVLLSKVMPGADFAGPPAFRCAVFAVVTLFLGVVALIACWLPARRAAKVEPIVALRAE
ncbi:MAG: ABC transporter permease [Opitutae bacterium]|nr:ABC transporter permease [Opitutae bacterium]